MLNFSFIALNGTYRTLFHVTRTHYDLATSNQSAKALNDKLSTPEHLLQPRRIASLSQQYHVISRYVSLSSIWPTEPTQIWGGERPIWI